MKHLLYTLALICLFPLFSHAQLVELAQESFEGDANDHGYTISPGSECHCCGNGRYYAWHRADVNASCLSSTVSGIDGNWFWSAENVDDGLIQDPPSSLAPRAALTLNDVDVSGSTDLEIRLLVGEGATDHFDLGDFLRIQYAFDGGSYQTASQFIPTGADNSDLAFDADADGTIDGAELTSAFAEFVVDLGSNIGSTLSVRLLFDTRGFSEEIIVDHIRVYGTNAPLPVELLDFEVKAIEESVLLNWTTTEERQLAGFGIERSADGRFWQSIGWADAQNNSQLGQYQFVDRSPLPTKGYYRLRMEDLDGKKQHSSVKSLDGVGRLLQLGTPSPNPLYGSRLRLPIRVHEFTEAELFIYDQRGRQIDQLSLRLSPGQSTVEVNSSAWPTGLLYLQLRAGNNTSSAKLMRFAAE
ncbi:MAG: hypothetical protein AAFV95_09470 [Bacteroidota bacterium]